MRQFNLKFFLFMSQVEKQLQFFKSQGIEHQKLSIQFEDGSYSVIAAESLKVGDVVARIPKEAVLSIQNTAIADIIEEENLRGILGLGLAVLYEKSLGPSSPWYEYLSTIPDYENIPIFYDSDALKYLQNTDVGRSIHEDVSFLVEDFQNYIAPLLDNEKYPQLDAKYITEENWLRVASLISSRAFQVDSFHGEALCPLADLFNHLTDQEHVHCEGNDEMSEDEWESEEEADKDDDGNTAPELETVDEANEYLEFVVVRPCKKGNQIFNTYGNHPNSSLLRLYGFVDAENQYSKVSVSRLELIEMLGMDPSDKRILFWETLAKQIIEEIFEMDMGDENEGNYEEDNETQSLSDTPEEESACCQQDDCSGCSDGELDSDHLSDGFCFNRNGLPSLELVTFMALMFMSIESISSIAEDIDLTVDMIVQLKDQLDSASTFSELKFGKLLNNEQHEKLKNALKEVADNRLGSYEDLPRPAKKGPLMWAYLLREEEKIVLRDFINGC